MPHRNSLNSPLNINFHCCLSFGLFIGDGWKSTLFCASGLLNCFFGKRKSSLDYTTSLNYEITLNESVNDEIVWTYFHLFSLLSFPKKIAPLSSFKLKSFLSSMLYEQLNGRRACFITACQKWSVQIQFYPAWFILYYTITNSKLLSLSKAAVLFCPLGSSTDNESSYQPLSKPYSYQNAITDHKRNYEISST